MTLEVGRFLGALFDKLRPLALARGGESGLFLLPLVIGIFQRGTNLIVEIIAHYNRFVAVGTEDDIADHEILDVFDVHFVAFEATQWDRPRVDCRKVDVIDLGFGRFAGWRRSVCRNWSGCWGGGGLARLSGSSAGRGCSRFALSFAKARFKVVAEISLGMDRSGARDQHLFRFDIVRVSDADVDRAHRSTGFVVVEADALRAQLRVDNIDRVALRNRIVRTLGFAGAAVDAITGNHRCHEIGPSRASKGMKIGVKSLLS